MDTDFYQKKPAGFEGALLAFGYHEQAAILKTTPINQKFDVKPKSTNQ